MRINTKGVAQWQIVDEIVLDKPVSGLSSTEIKGIYEAVKRWSYGVLERSMQPIMLRVCTLSPEDAEQLRSYVSAEFKDFPVCMGTYLDEFAKTLLEGTSMVLVPNNAEYERPPILRAQRTVRPKQFSYKAYLKTFLESGAPCTQLQNTEERTYKASAFMAAAKSMGVENEVVALQRNGISYLIRTGVEA